MAVFFSRHVAVMIGADGTNGVDGYQMERTALTVLMEQMVLTVPMALTAPMERTVLTVPTAKT